MIDERRRRVGELVGDLPKSDVRIDELGFNGSSLVTVGMVFRTERAGEVENGVKVGTKLVVFSSVIERRNVVVRGNPDLLIKKG